MPYACIDSEECSEVRDKEVNELLQKVRKFNSRWYIEENMTVPDHYTFKRDKAHFVEGKVRSYSVYYHAVGADFGVIDFPLTDQDKKNVNPFNWSPNKRDVLCFLKGLLEAYENPPKKSAD